MNKYKIALLVFSMLVGSSSYSQTDEDVIKDIYKHSLTQGKSYDWLNHLSNQIGSRLSGSLGAEKAVSWGKEELEKLGLDEVWLQPVMVPKWVRGAKEYAFIESEPGKTTTVNICAL
ncbi:MAG: peptidase M28 family protein, partial [Flavobacteriia bacterium]|nr:peptidase M28 family protein [Flavobacteriia bacterium]